MPRPLLRGPWASGAFPRKSRLSLAQHVFFLFNNKDPECKSYQLEWPEGLGCKGESTSLILLIAAQPTLCRGAPRP